MSSSAHDLRVLILAPTGRDGPLAAGLLKDAGIACVECADIDCVIEKLEGGAAAALIADESLTEAAVEKLMPVLDGQPAWSDFPFVVFTNGGRRTGRVATWLQTVGNVTLIDRPVRLQTLVSQMRSVLRARQRQYTARDVLHRLEAQKVELRALDKAKDQFLATLSHELRTPLTAIMGWTQLLATGRIPPAKQKQALETIERNAIAQAQLVEDLLDVSRITANNLKLEPRPFELDGAISASVEAMRPAARAKGVTLEVEGTSVAGTPFSGDEPRIQQVLSNLISNGIKFTPAGGSVTVSLRSSADGHRIDVRDTGQGIEPTFLPHVFDRFRQQDGSTTRRHGGLGLGLAIVRHLVELHGGAVFASSDGEGHGTTMSFTLPNRTESAAAPGPVAAAHARPSLGGVKVLIVEDQEDTRELLIETLEEFGASTVAAGSVAQGLRLFASSQPDLILSDIGMPGDDGYALIRTLRAGGSTVPAVAVTALAHTTDREAALEAGFQAHVAKPVDPERLAAVLARVLHEARSNPLQLGA
jgi:signal transduction histidine kinase/ActR/RegA family two-component response regulator